MTTFSLFFLFSYPEVWSFNHSTLNPTDMADLLHVDELNTTNTEWFVFIVLDEYISVGLHGHSRQWNHFYDMAAIGGNACRAKLNKLRGRMFRHA